MGSLSAFSALLVANAENIPNWFVVVMGIGIVFVSLVCIVFICVIMSAIIRKFEAKEVTQVESVKTPEVQAQIIDRPAFIAAVSACVAEELGTDVSAIRILSVKAV